MKHNLGIQACIKFICGILLVGGILFVPAGTLRYWNAWLFAGLLFIPMLILGVILLIRSPELLQKRLNNKESETTQKWVVALTGLAFVGGFVVAGLDFRFGWSHLPLEVVVAAAVVQLAAYGIYMEVMRENAYLSRTVEVQENQKVIDTGLYGVVRHPLYMAMTLLFWSMPLVLGSFWAFCVFFFCPLLMVKRIQNEEEVLEKGLEGYTEYKQRVKYRMIPFIW